MNKILGILAILFLVGVVTISVTAHNASALVIPQPPVQTNGIYFNCASSPNTAPYPHPAFNDLAHICYEIA